MLSYNTKETTPPFPISTHYFHNCLNLSAQKTSHSDIMSQVCLRRLIVASRNIHICFFVFSAVCICIYATTYQARPTPELWCSVCSISLLVFAKQQGLESVMPRIQPCMWPVNPNVLEGRTTFLPGSFFKKSTFPWNPEASGLLGPCSQWGEAAHRDETPEGTHDL